MTDHEHTPYISKDDERAAIRKILKIVESLGETSYVGTAMTGVLEMAEENIDYDAAFSFPRKIELQSEEIRRLQNEQENYRAEIRSLNDSDRLRRIEFDRLIARAEQAERKAALAEDECEKFCDANDKLHDKVETLEKQVAVHDDELTVLMGRCFQYYIAAYGWPPEPVAD